LKRKSRPGALPPISSSIWEERARPLLTFLVEPRNWFELTVWARANKVGGYLLRNYLAYLEDKRQADAMAVRSRVSGEILWVWYLLEKDRSEPLYSGYEKVDPSQIYRKGDDTDAPIAAQTPLDEEEIEEEEL
jgi:hypothetical protein